MARIERKAYYVGTWREDHVTDTTMRQIIARSHAEKGQKVKVKLSKNGLNLSRTVLFQENFLSSFPLSDVYFLTVNPHHPTCLLCIVADPVRKYLILVLRTANGVEAREMIAIFQRLKNNPTNYAGNVVLKRKDNGNWTLRERSQHNANRHLQQVFREASANDPNNSSAPNGHAGGHSPPFLEDSLEGRTTQRGRSRIHSASQTAGEGTEEEMALMKLEVENLSQELRDLKLVLEKTGTVNPRSVSVSSTTPLHNNGHNTYITTEVHRAGGGGGDNTSNGHLITAISEGEEHADYYRPGEARVFVEDHREDTAERGQSHRTITPNKPLFVNGRLRRQITVPEPISSPRAEPGYTIQRHVAREFVQAPSDVNRKLSSTHSLRSSAGVTIVPASSRRDQDRHRQFRSVRISRTSGVPTTIVRPIEEIYSHGNTLRRRSVVLVPVHYAVQEPTHAVYVGQQQHPQTSSAVYVARPITPTGSSRRSSQTSSFRATQDDEENGQHYCRELDDVLL